MPAVVHSKNVFGINDKVDLDDCETWLEEQKIEWQVYVLHAVLDRDYHVLAGDYDGPYLLFIPNNAVAVAFKLKFC